MSRAGTFDDFKCAHCGYIVTSAHWISGVKNRNHCPYCLWSRHLDLNAMGDRLSACKASMQPVALTTKRSIDKYGCGRGELMLVYQCTNCGNVSINRIAADDEASTLLDGFNDSRALPTRTLSLLLANEINILPLESLPVLQLQLFGEITNIRMAEIV
ncbi:MAG: RNHCP domain-containing protein [Anaerolineales bacterium]